MATIRDWEHLLVDTAWIGFVLLAALLYMQEFGFDAAFVAVLLAVISYWIGCQTQTLEIHN